MYYTDAGPESGPLLFFDAPSPIPVKDDGAGGTVVGSATSVGWLGAGEALWRLKVHGATLPGLFAVVDREFRPAP